MPRRPSPVPPDLYAFRYRDSRTGKWVRARYRATPGEIAARHAQWELLGPPEARPDGPVRMFNPASKLITYAELMRLEDRPPDLHPTIADDERTLLCLFLRRYVTWCARSRRYARMQGAAALHRRVCEGGR